jgi:hypothetical protein
VARAAIQSTRPPHGMRLGPLFTVRVGAVDSGLRPGVMTRPMAVPVGAATLHPPRPT